MKGLRFALGFLLLSSTFSSCIKSTFDSPPNTSQYDPNITTNLTIAQLSKLAYNLPSGSYRQLGDSTIYGIVTADDRTGNFYKQIVIQDSTGGIVLSIASYNLFNDYPVGRKVYVKLRGLTIINYSGLPEVALTANVSSGKLTVVGIPSAVVNNYIVKASYPNTVTPLKLRFSDIGTYGLVFCVNRLVTFENMEFDVSNAGLPYAAPSTVTAGTNRILNDCPKTSSIIMYNSGYATFQPVIMPTGKGTVTGIFSVYNATPQLQIRDTSDVQLTGNRDCP